MVRFFKILISEAERYTSKAEQEQFKAKSERETKHARDNVLRASLILTACSTNKTYYEMNELNCAC